jgi:hypothetical protein
MVLTNDDGVVGGVGVSQNSGYLRWMLLVIKATTNASVDDRRMTGM